MYGTCNTTVSILTQGYHCYNSIHGYSGIYGYEYVYSTCNTTVTIVYMDTLTQGVYMGMSTCTVHVIPPLVY